ncbi:MAG: hypothetical protein ACE5JR_00715 [Gemmatimonadota bacterium]
MSRTWVAGTASAPSTGFLRDFQELAEELRSRFRAWERAPERWSEGFFSELALRAFDLQFRRNVPYRRFCEARGITPSGVSSWREIPPVPTAAFRDVPLVVGSPEEAALEFVTSGTTGGPERRGRHLVRDPKLYRASLEAAFRVFVVQSDSRLRMLPLLPRFTKERASSLGWMVEAVCQRFGEGEPPLPAGAEGLDWSVADLALTAALESGEPLCILATTLAVDEWMRRLARDGVTVRLPARSRLMDTGGTKGRPGVERERVAREVEARLGIEPRWILNEFGMTELLSQRYATLEVPAGEAAAVRGAASEAATDGPPRRRASARDRPVTSACGPAAMAIFVEAGLLYGPPWLRTRVLDPVSLAELPEGETGILCHFDLANAGSVCAVLTEDLGRVRDGGVEWMGRMPGAASRGCSLATAELLAAQQRA